MDEHTFDNEPNEEEATPERTDRGKRVTLNRGASPTEGEPPRRSIRSIEIDGVRRAPTLPSRQPKLRSKQNRLPYYIGAGVVVAALAFIIISARTSRALITLTPKSFTSAVSVLVNLEGVAPEVDSEETEEQITPTDAISYLPLVFSREAEEVLEPTGEEQVEKKATGKITVYNNFSNESERLIANTRFQAPSGKIYRISDPIVIPGKTASGPGSLTVTVAADEVGEDYNLSAEGEVKFTIPGLQSDNERYSQMYATLAEPITGGYQGIVKSVEPEDEAAAREKLEKQLRSDLLAALPDEVKDDQIYFENTSRFEFEDLVNTEKGDKVAIRMKGTLYGMVIGNTKLAALLAAKKDTEMVDATYTITDSSELVLTLADSEIGVPELVSGTEASLSGTVTVEALIQEEDLKKRVFGDTRKSAVAKLEASSAVESATVELRPNWVRSIPSEPARITIELVSNKASE